MCDFLNELNEKQREAVLYNDGPSLVIAGAGAGKTRVLTYKIAWLLSQGYQPWNILALTFTNKAAREMKERIARQVGDDKRTRHLWMGTFHSIFLRILHAEGEHIGFSSHFTVYDTADSKSLLRTIIKEMQLDEKVYKPGLVQSRISNAKNRLVTPGRYGTLTELYEADLKAHVPQVADIYRRYWDRMKQADAMDFDDLLLYTYLLFKEHPDVLARYQAQFTYLLVDEYQDTNSAQHSIVLQLAGPHGHVCVVGDDAQSIYSFRGAEIDNILSFTKTFQNARVFKLEQNYRSTQTIVQAANSLIEKNTYRIPKEVFSQKETGEAIGLFQAYSDAEEAEIVAGKILELRRKEDSPYSDFAILYRTNAQSRVFEEVLRRRGMPYRIYGGLSFYQRKEIKDIVAYFRLITNPNDEEAFKRIVNYPPRGIGDTTVGKIATQASLHHVSLWEVVCNPAAYGLNVAKSTLNKLGAFQEQITAFIRLSLEGSAFDAGSAVIRQSGIIAEVRRENTPEAHSKAENIEELLNGLKEFTEGRQEEGNRNISLADYLSEISLITDQDSESEEEDGARITLMTMHAAKGLEFGTVFVVGLEENLFPSSMAGDSLRALEEERRLFYVAITRAERHCFLTFAKMRFRYGKMEFSMPSRFLRDIDVKYLKPQQNGDFPWGSAAHRPAAQEEKPAAPVRRPSITLPAAQKSLKPVNKVLARLRGEDIPRLQPGQFIQHERFGIGEVLRVEDTGENAKATIRFQHAGEKQLLLRFARFKTL